MTQTYSSSGPRRTGGPAAAIITLLVVGAGVLLGLYVDIMPPAASLQALVIDRLFNTMLGIAFAIFLLVEGVLLYVVLRFRRRPGHTGEGIPIHGSNRLELAWSFIPALIVFWLSAVSSQVILTLNEAPENPIVVRVVAQQFTWSFEYPEYGLTSADLNIPKDLPVVLELTSRDVIHSFWVPAFRMKEDALPMAVNDMTIIASSTGEYPIVCAELCGAGHSVMQARVIVMEKEAFIDWLAGASG